MSYEELLEGAPDDHHSEQFLDYLKANNTVVFETSEWLVIENVKYHKPDKPWYTAFHKAPCIEGCCYWYNDVDELWWHDDWQEWEWRKKSADKQTIRRFHIHIYKD